MSSVVSGVVGSAWDTIVQSFTQGVVDVLKVLMTFWMQVPGPGDALTQEHGPTVFLRQSTSWYVSALAVLSVLIAAAKIALTQRSQPGGDLGKALVRVMFAVWVGVPLIQVCLLAGDGYSQWIMSSAGGPGLQLRLTALWTISSATGTGLSSGLLFIIALVTLLASLAQLVLMLIRTAVVILLTGLWPLSASLSNTESGYQWWQRSNGWLLAFVLFKPAAATVYATAFAILGTGQDLATFVSGIALLALAVLTLPALMRLAVPAVAAAAAGGGGGMAAAAGGAVATGAMLTARLGGTGPRGGGGGPGPRTGNAPTGSSGGSGSPGPAGPSTGPPGGPSDSGSSAPTAPTPTTPTPAAPPPAAPASATPASTGAASTGAGTTAGSAVGPVGAVVGAGVAGVANASGAVKSAGHDAMGDSS